jgi:hypothetical protein
MGTLQPSKTILLQMYRYMQDFPFEGTLKLQKQQTRSACEQVSVSNESF